MQMRGDLLPKRTDVGALRPDVQQGLTLHADFKNYVHDVSNSVLFALERRHLDYLDITSLPDARDLDDLDAIDYRFLKLNQIGHGPAVERSLDVLNMQNILGTFRDGSHSFVMALRATGRNTGLYFGARRVNGTRNVRHTAYDFVQNLRRTIEGNLPGTSFERFASAGNSPICPDDVVASEILEPLADFQNLAALTGIPSLRANREEQFAQSLDRLVQALQGQNYMMLIVAEPLREENVSEVLSNCLRLNSEIHSWVRISTSFSQAISDSLATARATGKVTGEGDSLTQAKNISKGLSKQPTAVAGGLVGAGVGLMLSAMPGLGAAAYAISNLASSAITQRGGSISENIGDSTSTSRSRNWSQSVTDSLTESSSKSETASINVEYLNKTAEYCERVLDGYVARLQKAKNLGAWNVGVYFLADDPATFAQGQAQLRSLYSGKETYYEPMRTVNLSHEDVRPRIVNVLSTFSNPQISLSDSQNNNEPLPHPLGKLHSSLSTPLTTEELSLLMNLPRREVPGLKLELVADFGVNPKPLNPADGIRLGNVVSGGTMLDIPVGIDSKDLTRHIFITGITGSGKTNTCFALLKSVARRRIPTLVIEPAKGEYRGLLGDADIRNLRVYTPGDETVAPFRINPFQFVPGMNLITHLDNLKAIFNASFPMYASMPYMLEEAVVQCYEDKGWDLIHSTNSHINMRDVVDNWKRGFADYSYAAYLPTLSDLQRKIDSVVYSKGYAQEASSNFVAALKSRIGSLLLGSKGRMLDVQRGIPFEQLFGPLAPPASAKPSALPDAATTVLELRSVGDDDEKCFLMAMLLVQLYEYREQLYRWNNQTGLQHLTVLEESHRLLGRAAPVGGSSEQANPRGKAVDAFANMLAEIREYGEGFLIIDQTPAKLIPDVVKNTSTKILHRLTARDDRDAMGDAMGMNEEQKQMVPRMRAGDGIFHSQDQDKPVWIKVPLCKGLRKERVTDDDVRALMAPTLAQMRDEVTRDNVQKSQNRRSAMAAFGLNEG